MPIRKMTLRRNRKKIGKIDLKIELKDFGPLSGGKITLKPLTLFIGPNNSGKSYAAMLIHSIFESYISTLPRGLPHFMRQGFLGEYLESNSFLKEFPELRKQIDDLEEGREVEFPQQFIVKVTNKIFEEVYEKRLSKEIARAYACPLNELIKIGSRAFEFKINFNSHCAHLICQRAKIKIKKYPQVDIKIKVKAIISALPIIDVEENENEVLFKLGRPGKKMEGKKFTPFPVIDIILDVCASKIFKNVRRPCYYLPAARSGILQGHKALAASIVRKAQYVGIERLEIPKFSGVVSDFISSVLTLPEEEGPFYKLAQDFEKELIKGEIEVRPLDEYVRPEIKYRFQGSEIPLHRASSTVSELAPLILYLKYIIEPRNILIIEEPEAHLHPENQRILAKFLVKLVRKGVNIVITTHSEYLLEQLSSFILLSKVEPKKRVERYKYSREDFLKHDEIATYVFNYDRESAGHKITEVEITEEDGISQEEFLKIHESLYEETFKLRRDLSTKK